MTMGRHANQRCHIACLSARIVRTCCLVAQRIGGGLSFFGPNFSKLCYLRPTMQSGKHTWAGSGVAISLFGMFAAALRFRSEPARSCFRRSERKTWVVSDRGKSAPSHRPNDRLLRCRFAHQTQTDQPKFHSSYQGLRRAGWDSGQIANGVTTV